MELEILRNFATYDRLSQNLHMNLKFESRLFFDAILQNLPDIPKLQRQNAIRQRFDEESFGIVSTLRQFPRVSNYIYNWILFSETKTMDDIYILYVFLKELLNDTNEEVLEVSTIYLLRYISQNLPESKAKSSLHSAIRFLLENETFFMYRYCEDCILHQYDRYEKVPSFQEDIKIVFNRIAQEKGYKDREDYLLKNMDYLVKFEGLIPVISK